MQFLLCAYINCKLKNLKKRCQEKWENAYLTVNNVRASRALRRALDPADICSLRSLSSATRHRNFLKNYSCPPPVCPCWIRYWHVMYDHGSMQVPTILLKKTPSVHYNHSDVGSDHGGFVTPCSDMMNDQREVVFPAGTLQSGAGFFPCNYCTCNEMRTGVQQTRADDHSITLDPLLGPIHRGSSCLNPDHLPHQHLLRPIHRGSSCLNPDHLPHQHLLGPIHRGSSSLNPDHLPDQHLLGPIHRGSSCLKPDHRLEPIHPNSSVLSLDDLPGPIHQDSPNFNSSHPGWSCQ